LARCNILDDFRNDLARRIARSDGSPAPEPLPISPWLAMALLQKAVRRGRADLALQAGATLLVDAPDRIWRRCGGIAFEDVGIADPEVLGLVAVVLGGKRARVQLGGEWAVASVVVEATAAANKRRAADDLLMSVELRPALAATRQAQAKLSNDNLRGGARGRRCNRAHRAKDKAALRQAQRPQESKKFQAISTRRRN
jgi:hypothetical protein